MKKLLLIVAFISLSKIKAQIDPLKYPTYTNIKDAVKSDKPVYSISLRDKGLFNIPKDIVKMNSLFFLNVMGNNLEKIDQEIFTLKELEILNLNANSIKFIPNEIL